MDRIQTLKELLIENNWTAKDLISVGINDTENLLDLDEYFCKNSEEPIDRFMIQQLISNNIAFVNIYRIMKIKLESVIEDLDWIVDVETPVQEQIDEIQKKIDKLTRRKKHLENEKEMGF